jgi:hypothetical protein
MMTVTKVTCRAGCGKVFEGHSFYNARYRHEKKEHPDWHSPTLNRASKKPRAKKAAPVKTDKRPEWDSMFSNDKKKDVTVPVVLNYCPFCAHALPNAHVIQGRH